MSQYLVTSKLWQVGRQIGTEHSPKPLAKAFAFCFYFLISKSQIKRFGGLCKYTQAIKVSTFQPYLL